ncbi:MAG: 3-methyl-2-oxobutanoate hydroxymethyltransferase [Aminobacterium sp.]|jgi:3-methyl-2-oxobutanoate hydroxymethyltransferase|uniref:3-methyl-2-oxobutanoate hydroxymethyltransferase n=1 Tax=unclassified Aminobacterium TaxID=2685012 RepID=UPI001BCCE763|nr:MULTISPECIES: 3-methyl-2-oxobutanoate hydroxymethyltransferase [unclassified Aminobacterium]MDD2206371.1 3-methyl-2-oxobutanoate hydroxymethyltransferase [Aminobacterium sp.]MDD3426487.1 3-methyl-2-oxobutanoate hydroxymethyltransferase [Aminobacterium sp.]MDD3707482.1 3-methyl-2-oxobutanoate hydroxymethyltransferase [Aminobacterium sp.]MDD4228388.1 3-methyl-2-oxobutanoate hydroxymethyltransferase [Aminobacterium sp.]MDD4552284.1 3-methyl-2-oxobutanoate hydroxymethyltransferase [Aminobacteri
MAKVTIQKLKEMKQKGEKISMVTAYDYAQAVLVEKSGIEIILVGDSLSMTMLGNDGTVPLTTDEMVAHIKPVVKGAPTPMIVGDMVFGSYNESISQAIRSANRLMKEGGCDVIKLEGGRPEVVSAIVEAGIPVQGHIGLTPQTASMLGGFKVQGKSLEAAQKIVDEAKALEDAGAFSIVVECVPEELGRAITEAVSIPIIGIGAGRYTDGQVLVFHDMLGLFDKFLPKFVKQYAQIGDEIVKALGEYKEEVRSGSFPEDKHTFGGLSRDDLKDLRK